MFTNSTSLIIPTRNRPNSLKNLLQKFSDLSVHFFEIIVVDVVDGMTWRLVNLRKFVCRVNVRGLSHARRA